jgi:hypothetical protein
LPLAPRRRPPFLIFPQWGKITYDAEIGDQGAVVRKDHSTIVAEGGEVDKWPLVRKDGVGLAPHSLQPFPLDDAAFSSGQVRRRRAGDEASGLPSLLGGLSTSWCPLAWGFEVSPTLAVRARVRPVSFRCARYLAGSRLSSP